MLILVPLPQGAQKKKKKKKIRIKCAFLLTQTVTIFLVIFFPECTLREKFQVLSCSQGEVLLMLIYEIQIIRQVLQAQHCLLILLRFLYFFISVFQYPNTLTHNG